MYSSDVKYLLKHAGIEIHTRYHTSPISLKVFCEHYDLKYLKLPLDKNTCGMLVRSENDKYIAINEGHPYTRRRFSLAHEIGHYFLGHESEVSRINEQNRREEIQANKYASSLLMPDELFHYVHKENITIKAVANWLRVSPISVSIRCLEFGIRHMEAELMKSDYYFSMAEVAATAAEARGRYQESKPNRQGNWHNEDYELLELKYGSVWKQNEETLDRLRRNYGYE